MDTCAGSYNVFKKEIITNKCSVGILLRFEYDKMHIIVSKIYFLFRTRNIIQILYHDYYCFFERFIWKVAIIMCIQSPVYT